MADNHFQQNPSDDDNPMTDIQRDEKLAGDYTRPYSPPDGIKDHIDDTHPSTDSNIDEQEHYDAGIEAAANLNLSDEQDHQEAV